MIPFSIGHSCVSCGGTDVEIYEVDELLESHAFCRDCGFWKREAVDEPFGMAGRYRVEGVRISETGCYVCSGDDGRLICSDVSYRKNGRTYVVWTCSVCGKEAHI